MVGATAATTATTVTTAIIKATATVWWCNECDEPLRSVALKELAY